MRLIKIILLQIINVGLSTLIGGTLFWLTRNLTLRSYEVNLYSSAIEAGLLFSSLTYIAFFIYRRFNNKTEHVLRNELIFCYVFSMLLWILILSITFGVNFDQITTIGLTISMGVLCIPLFKKYIDPIFLS